MVPRRQTPGPIMDEHDDITETPTVELL